MNKPKILLIDDNKDFVECAKLYLEAKGYVVTTAYDGEAGLQCFHNETPDCIVVDILMPNKTGYDVYAEVRNSFPHLPIIICTSTGLLIKTARKDLFVTHLKKPFEMPLLEQAIQKLVSAKLTI